MRLKKIFSHYWARRGANIENAAFEFDVAEGAALSWHLTDADKKELTRQGERLGTDFKNYSEAAKKWTDLFRKGDVTEDEEKNK
ncbi:MAG: hypothetical protein ABIT37_25055 [Luteolibacter sp.]